MRVTVAAFIDEPRAEIVRGRLLVEGIEATLRDQYLVGINWLYSRAVGGVKLEVDVAHAGEAARILANDYSDPLEEQKEGGLLSCAKCGANEVVSYDPLRILAAFTLFPMWPLVLLLGIPFIKWEARAVCLNCRHKW